MAAADPIKQAAKLIRITDFLSYRDYLAAIYAHLKKKLAGYTYELFAGDLGFPPSNVLRLAISNRRNLSARAADKVVAALALSGQDRRYFLALVAQNNAKGPAKREALFRELLAIKTETLPSTIDRVKLEYYSEWYHPIIREMTAMEGFRSDPKWIASQLYYKVTPKQIEHSLSVLEQLGLVRYDAREGRHFQTGGQIMVDRNIDHISVIRYHQTVLELSRESVTLVPVEERDLNAMTVCVDEALMPKAREILEQACAAIFELEKESKERTSVFQVNTQLFRITTRRKRQKRQ